MQIQSEKQIYLKSIGVKDRVANVITEAHLRKVLISKDHHAYMNTSCA